MWWLQNWKLLITVAAAEELSRQLVFVPPFSENTMSLKMLLSESCGPEMRTTELASFQGSPVVAQLGTTEVRLRLSQGTFWASENRLMEHPSFSSLAAYLKQ